MLVSERGVRRLKPGFYFEWVAKQVATHRETKSGVCVEVSTYTLVFFSIPLSVARQQILFRQLPISYLGEIEDASHPQSYRSQLTKLATPSGIRIICRIPFAISYVKHAKDRDFQSKLHY